VFEWILPGRKEREDWQLDVSRESVVQGQIKHGKDREWKENMTMS
jgi:hypothetical protein